MRACALIVSLAVVLLAGCGGEKEDTATTKTTSATERAAQARARVKARAADAKRMERVTAPAGSCLEELGFKVTGGSPRVTDERAPDYQLVLNARRRGHGAIVAYYNDLARAKTYAEVTRKNARKLKSTTVEQRGAINIVWVRLPDPALRGRVRACLVRDS